MQFIVLLARVVLALIFVVAGLAKLADLTSSRQALRDFGLPAFLANPFGVLLPLAELAVAIALVPTVSAWWGALGALALLLLFVAGIALNLVRGRHPECHCFGQLHLAPAGWPTLLRHLVLAAVAGVVVGFGRRTLGPGPFDWLAALTVSQRIEMGIGVVVLALLLGEGWLLFQVMVQQGRVLLRIEAIEAELTAKGMAPQPAPAAGAAVPVPGLPVGSSAPDFALANLTEETITLTALRALSKPVLLIFSDPGCGPCAALLPEVGSWQRDYAGKLTLAVISQGSLEANHSKFKAYGITRVLLQQEREVAAVYQVTGTPSAVLISADGTIDSRLAQGADAIRNLVASTIGSSVLRTVPLSADQSQRNGHGAMAVPRPPTGLKIGEAAPDFSLPDLSGNPVHLSNFRGHKTLVLFWRPSCGFCQRMLPDLKAWEAQSSEEAPRLLVVSTESVQDNQAMGLRSPIVLDQAGMSIGSTFAASGTPMAVLVDAEGRIASQPAAGAPAVLALARRGLEKTIRTR